MLSLGNNNLCIYHLNDINIQLIKKIPQNKYIVINLTFKVLIK